jgi:hypothetical protein
MKYCQGTKCHEYRTKDRIRGTKGQKYYATRRRTHLLFDLFCSQTCLHDWIEEYAERAIDHYGRTTDAKKTECDNAWYKQYDWRNGTNHYFVNDLLGQRIPITEQQYNDKNLIKPN